MATVLMPLPSHDFDPTESGLPWRVLESRGHRVVFATPDGRPAEADARMLTGEGLGPAKHALMADANGREAYAAMSRSEAFAKPLRHEQIDHADYDGLLLPGGHAPRMREYLESHLLQGVVSAMFAADKPVAAVCHGVVLVARSLGKDGLSVLHGRKTTALLELQEMLAWNVTRLWRGDYYRTYPQSVQAEVTEALASPEDFVAGPAPLLRDAPGKLHRGFTVRDGNYLSARWPGDVHRFAEEFAGMLPASR